MHLVGISGNAGAGKDTLADFFSDRGWYNRSSSDALYREVSEAFDVPEWFLRKRETKEVPTTMLSPERCADLKFVELVCRLYDLDGDMLDFAFSPRTILQLWGTDYRRAEDENYWLNRLDEEYLNLKDSGAVGLIFPSVRFSNERDWLISRGGHHVLVTRPGCEPVNSYVSESIPFKDKIEIEISNDGTISDFYCKSMSFLEWIESGTPEE